MPDRRIPAPLARRIAVHGLGRTACVYADPARDEHDHAAMCLTDDESRTADAMLELLIAATTGNETAALDKLSLFMERVKQPD